MPTDYDKAHQLIANDFTKAEKDLLKGAPPSINIKVQSACNTLFVSRTQAYREVLLGCTIARIQDKLINIRQPYVDQGPNAFSGRSLDEKVINPFLHEKRIPCSRGPYLSVFRRSIKFDRGIRSGLRDKNAYDAFLKVIKYLESVSDKQELSTFLRYLLYKFAELRESSNIPLARLQQISLEQYDILLSGLLTVPSGGRIPMMLVVATFTAIKEFFKQKWEISWQGINVSDTASGAGGDVTISANNQILMAVEVTERPISKSRVTATFNTKIAPAGIEDYIFFIKSTEVDPDARQQARQYFAQGHEVNFLEIKEWIIMSLATISKQGRSSFNKALLELIDKPDVPSTIKVAWNDQIAQLTG